MHDELKKARTNVRRAAAQIQRGLEAYAYWEPMRHARAAERALWRLKQVEEDIEEALKADRHPKGRR